MNERLPMNVKFSIVQQYTGFKTDSKQQQLSSLHMPHNIAECAATSNDSTTKFILEQKICVCSRALKHHHLYSSTVCTMSICGITSVRYPSTEQFPYKRCRTLKNIGCRYIQATKLNRNMRSRVSTRFCINFVFERAVPFSYRVIYTFPVNCHCRRRCSVVL